MQLSNFWRDIGQDMRIGRTYIALEEMGQLGYSLQDLKDKTINDALIELLNFEFKRTEEFYERARAGVAWLASGQWGVMSALEIYRAIMNSIRQNKYDVFNHRAGTTRMQKLSLVARARTATLLGNMRRPNLSESNLLDRWQPRAVAGGEQIAQQ
jgi:phytoene synthase